MDNRTKKQKLQDMANQSVSPNEAEIAKRKLKELPPEESTPRISVNFSNFKYTTSGSPSNFADPFRETNGEGVFVYDFTNEKWVKVD